MPQNELDQMSGRIAERLGLQPHEIIFHRSNISIQMYNKNPIMVFSKGDVIDLSDYSPFGAVDSVIRYIVYGPTDTEARKK